MPTFLTLANFNLAGSVGPNSSLVEGAQGDLFGTTIGNGTSDQGSVFELVKTSTGYASTPITLATFGEADGGGPAGRLFINTQGDLIGTTYAGDGTAFEIAKTGTGYATTPVTLVTFNGTNGSQPNGGLIADANGDLFGTTAEGATNGGGTVFEIAKTATGYASTVTTLATFDTNGRSPNGDLVIDAQGDLFGTTAEGGADDEGTVFELPYTGSGYAATPTTLVAFNGTDGAYPAGGLTVDAAGDLFGVTIEGGAANYGTVFEVSNTTTGYASTPVTLVAFDGTDGEDPNGSLAIDTKGDLFGTTPLTTTGEAAFEIAKTATGYASTPNSISTSGGAPEGGLIADAADNLFGVTYGGGINYDGTIFEITPSDLPSSPAILFSQDPVEVGVGQASLVEGISIFESNATAGETFTVTVSDGSGHLSATGAAGNGGNSLNITGSIKTANSALASLYDTEATAGSDTLTITVSDSLGGTATPAAIPITAIGPLAVIAPSSVTVPPGQASALSGISLSENGSRSDEYFAIALSNAKGTFSVAHLSAGGGYFSGSGTTFLDIVGTLGEVNAELATLTYTGGTSSSDTIRVTASDSVGNVTEGQIAVAVSGLLLAAPSSAIISQNRATSVAGISVSEAGVTPGESFNVTLSDKAGLLSATGSGVVGAGTTELTITGSLQTVNADLNALTDTDATTSTDTIVLTATDSLGNPAPSQSIAVSVVTAPVLTAPAALHIGVAQPAPISGLSLAAPGAAPGATYTVTVSDAFGLLAAGAAGGVAVTGAGTTHLALAGTLAQINAALATLTDTEVSAVSDTITVTAADALSDAAPLQTVAVSSYAQPVLTAPPAVGLIQGEAVPVSISLDEPGDIAGDIFTVTLSDTNGLLSASGAGVAGSGSNDLVITGSLDDVNTALATLAVTDSSTTQDSIAVNVANSFGGTASASTPVVIAALAPQISSPSELGIVDGVTSPVGVSLDPGALEGETVTATVNDTTGTLAATGTGVTEVSPQRLTITGSPEQVDAALSTLTDTEASTTQDLITVAVSDVSGNAATRSIAVSAAPASASATTAVPGAPPSALLSAILAMDSYNRNYGAYISGLSDAPGTELGDATILMSDPDQLTGFYALAYLWNGQTVISYRGTDLFSVSNGFKDIVFGWVGGAGILTPQFAEAEGFYTAATQGQTILSGRDPNVFLTGHSLGGGLAGFIAALTGDTATIFDSMPYGAATFIQYLESLPDAVVSTLLSLLSSGGRGAIIPFPNSSNITTYYTTGEVLQYVRAVAPAVAAGILGSLYTSKLKNPIAGYAIGAAAGVADIALTAAANNQQALDPHANTSLGDLIRLHSMPLLVVLEYADTYKKTSWQQIGPQLFAAYNNANIGYSLGLTDGNTGAAPQMMTMIAYSALTSGTMPFGNTGIVALFQDADALGVFYKSQYVPAVLNKQNVIGDLADIVVEYAGLLATSRNQVQASAPGAMPTIDSVISSDVTGQDLEVDLSAETWLDKTPTPSLTPGPGEIQLIGESELIGTVFFGTQFATDDDADQLVFGTDTPGSYSLDLSADTGVDMVYAGGGTVTVTLGTGTTDFLAGSGTATLVAKMPGAGIEFTGGTGDSTINTAAVSTDEIIDVLARTGNITVDLGKRETFRLDDPNRYNNPSNVGLTEFYGSIAGFAAGNVIDLQDILADQATLGAGNALDIQETDGVTFSLQLSGDYTGYLFETLPDGDDGTDIRIATLTIAPVDPTFDEGAGPEDFTVTRFGDLSQPETIYISTTDGTTIPGESINTGDFDPLSFETLTFAAGENQVDFTVTITDGDTVPGAKRFGIQATDGDASDAMPNVLGYDAFNVVVPQPPTATADGCPHFTTFDGLHFDFQGAGEFVAAKATAAADTFQVQMRIEPEGSEDSSVSIITQIAVQVGADRVTFDASRSQVVWVNGVASTLGMSNAKLVLAGGTVTEVSQNDYRVTLNTGEAVTINPFGDGMGFSIALANGDGAGSVQGFLGADEGKSTDFQLPDGTVLQQPLSQDALYQTFANAWRVTDATSLMDYASGQDTETFTNTQYPREVLTLADFPADLVAQAAALVAAAGITDPVLAADAEFDYISMGNPSFITEDAEVAGSIPTRSALSTSTPAVITDHVTPRPSIGALASSPSVTESATGTTAVTFNVELTSAATNDTVVDYAVMPNVDELSSNTGKTFFGAADFGGTAPTGSVTITTGQTSASFTIDLLSGALGNAPDKWLGVSLTTTGSGALYSPTAQTEILNPVPSHGTPAQPTLALLTAASITSRYPATLAKIGSAYTLNLGKILAGTGVPQLQLAIANAAASGSDSETAVISNKTGSGVAISGDQTAVTVAAGSAYKNLYIQPLTATAGTYAEVLTLSLNDTNSTGYSSALSDITLTLEETVVAPAAATVVGSGPDEIALEMSEDAYLGDAQFTVSVDGQQIGGVQATNASHAAGQSEVLDVLGSFGAGQHVVVVNFINDAYGTPYSPTADRNLYVDGATINGNRIGNADLVLDSNGPQTFSFGQSPATITVGSGPDTLALAMAEDAYLGDAEFTVSVDGAQVGGLLSATALHAIGQSQTLDVMGSFDTGPHTVSVDFINDGYATPFSPTADRNLYVDNATINGTTIGDSTLALFSQGPQSFSFGGPAAPITIGAGNDTLTLLLSEDAYLGDAQFTVSVDGSQIGGVLNASASHAAGQDQILNVLGTFAAKSHIVSVDFLNDLYAGTPATDRNLYVDGATINGNVVADSTLALYPGGPQSFTFTEQHAGVAVTPV